MVTEFGLSPELGPVGYPSGEQKYLPGQGSELIGHRFSEQTQRVVDREVARLLRDAEASAVRILREHRGALDALAAELVEHETVDGATVLEVLNRDARRPSEVLVPSAVAQR
jgi:cell division protease FtsH